MNTFNFIEEYKLDNKICDNFINYFKKNIEYRSLGSSSEQGFDPATMDTFPVFPVQTNYIMFTKDNRANLSNVKGYYAEIEFRNNSREEAELFAVTMRVGESSK